MAIVVNYFGFLFAYFYGSYYMYLCVYKVMGDYLCVFMRIYVYLCVYIIMGDYLGLFLINV